MKLYRLKHKKSIKHVRTEVVFAIKILMSENIKVGVLYKVVLTINPFSK